MAGRDPRRAASDRRLARSAALVFALLLPALLRILLTIPAHAPLDHNEGWNAYVADRIVQGRPLYPDPPRFFANNYPPLSFYALSPFGTRRIAAGRAATLTSFVLWVALLAGVATRLGCSTAEATFAAALFAAIMLSLSSYVGVHDPQLLGHVPQAAALFLLAGRPRSDARLIGTAVLLSMGVFVKHSLAMLPLALVVWLFQIDRRAAWRLMAAGACCAVVGGSLCVWIYGPGFVTQLLTARDYSVSDTLRATILFLVRNAVFLALGVMLARRRAGDEAAALVTTYLAVSVVLGLPLIGGAGVDWNVLFDANAACALAAAVAINRLMTDRVAIASIACLLLPIGGALGSARWAWLSSDYWLAPRSIESAETDRDVAFIRAHDGPAFCADLALCWRAGKPEEVDTWTTEQRGARDPALLDALARLVDERYYAVLHIGSAPLQLGSRFATALEQRYVVDHRGILGTVLVPRPDPHPP